MDKPGFVFFSKQEKQLIQVKHLFPKVPYLKAWDCEQKEQ